MDYGIRFDVMTSRYVKWSQRENKYESIFYLKSFAYLFASQELTDLLLLSYLWSPNWFIQWWKPQETYWTYKKNDELDSAIYNNNFSHQNKTFELQRAKISVFQVYHMIESVSLYFLKHISFRIKVVWCELSVR